MAKLTPDQRWKLSNEYLVKRKELLQSKVNSLGVKLFDMVYNNYLSNLEQSDGKLLNSTKNFDIVRGLDKIYNTFINNDNAQTVKSFVEGVQGIVPLNAAYFSSITKQDTKQHSKIVSDAVNKSLGLDSKNRPIQNGFVDKFIRDKTLLKKIKKQTNQAIVKGTGFQEFRQQLKTTIQGNSDVENSGGLHQYYRNYAYDTYVKVDRMSSDLMAKEFGMNYFSWSGPEIPTSRPLCKLVHNKIIDSRDWNNVTDYTQLKLKYRQGMDENTDPSQDLGGYGCQHRKRYMLDSVANQLKGMIVNVDDLLS